MTARIPLISHPRKSFQKILRKSSLSHEPRRHSFALLIILLDRTLGSQLSSPLFQAPRACGGLFCRGMYNGGMDLSENRRARFDYEIEKSYEAGIELYGHEVKSVKGGQFQIAGSRVLIRGGEAYLVNSHVPPYQPKNTPSGYEEDRARRLLLTREEIKELTGALQEKGRILIPLRAYLKNRIIKLELGLGRTRKKSDKREVLKKKAHDREVRREVQ